MRLTRAEAAARTREKLIAAADRVFVREGFHGATVEAVAAEAAVTTGAIYSSFGGKSELFLAVVDRRFDERIAELGELEKEPFGPERTRLAAKQWLERVRRERDWQVALLEFRLHAARDNELNRAFAQRQRRFVAAAVRTRRGRPEKESPRAAEQKTRALVALGNGYALERLTDPDRVSVEEFVEAATTMMRTFEEEGTFE